MTFSGSEVHVWLLVVLMVVAATVNAAPAPSEVVKAVGPLEWLFGSSVDRLGVANESAAEEEGRRRVDKPLKTKKDKNTKRITSGVDTVKNVVPVGHATHVPSLSGRPISLGGISQIKPGNTRDGNSEESSESKPSNGIFSSVSSSYNWNPLTSLFPSWSLSNTFNSNLGGSTTTGIYSSGSQSGGYDNDGYEEQYEEHHGYDREPTKSQVIVVTLPEIVRTVGKTIYDWNEAFAKYAESFGDRLYNSLNLNGGTEAVGAGLHAVIPLKDFDDPENPYGPGYNKPLGVPSIPALPSPIPPGQIPNMNFPQFPIPALPTLPPFPQNFIPSFPATFPAVPTFQGLTGLPTINSQSSSSFSVNKPTGR